MPQTEHTSPSPFCSQKTRPHSKITNKALRFVLQLITTTLPRISTEHGTSITWMKQLCSFMIYHKYLSATLNRVQLSDFPIKSVINRSFGQPWQRDTFSWTQKITSSSVIVLDVVNGPFMWSTLSQYALIICHCTTLKFAHYSVVKPLIPGSRELTDPFLDAEMLPAMRGTNNVVALHKMDLMRGFRATKCNSS